VHKKEKNTTMNADSLLSFLGAQKQNKNKMMMNVGSLSYFASAAKKTNENEPLVLCHCL
jgi:hypothetical protein